MTSSVGSSERRTSESLEERSKRAVQECHFGGGFVRPAYDSFCFAHLPGVAESTLLGSTTRINLPSDVISGLGSFDHLVYFFFDAFGWESFERFRGRSEILKAFESDGLVMKATSQFPSTTSAHVTTESTGLPVFKHAVCGWDYYEPRVGAMIKPLVLSFSGDSEEGTLLQAGHSPRDVLPAGEIIPNASERGIAVYRLGPKAFFPSPNQMNYLAAGQVKGYSSLDDGLTQVSEILTASKGKSYQMIYADMYDSTCHKHGIGSGQADGVAKAMLTSLSSSLKWRAAGRTLLVVFADHGHIATPAAKVINILEVMPSIRQYLKVGSNGEPIRFSGGCRQLFLHPREDCVSLVKQELSEKLSGAAVVMSFEEACANKMFGQAEPTEHLRERVGSILIFPLAEYSVAWIEPPKFKAPEQSNHGGASPQEMEIPILMLPLEG